MIYSFANPFDLARWIKANITNELRQEQLMYEGTRNKRDGYSINVTVSEMKYSYEDEDNYDEGKYPDAEEFHNACGDR